MQKRNSTVPESYETIFTDLDAEFSRHDGHKIAVQEPGLIYGNCDENCPDCQGKCYLFSGNPLAPFNSKFARNQRYLPRVQKEITELNIRDAEENITL